MADLGDNEKHIYTTAVLVYIVRKVQSFFI